jgi:four helix bundle protein
MIESYRDLIVWQRAISLATKCYEITSTYPREEVYGLIAQTRRSAVSIAANIAEGHGRESTGAFIQFLRNAQGSLKELETHLIVAMNVKIAGEEQAQPLFRDCEEIGKMLRGLIRSLQDRESRS